MEKRRKPWTIYRSAVTGRFVSRAYAEAHPDTTISHVIRPDEGGEADANV